jgi:hypothetical protein
MTVETEVAALTSAVNLLTSTVNVSKATLDASVAAAEAAYDSFDDRYLGAKVSAPSLDNDGGSLLTGALYFNSTENAMYVYTGASWVITTNYNNVTAPYTLAQTLNTNGNNVTFGDNGKAIFGAGSDLQIYHDGGNSIITNSTGNLIIRDSVGGNILIQGLQNQPSVDAIANGAVNLYYSGSPKLATTATGIDVTGTATMDGLTVQTSQGNISIPTNTSSLNFDRAGANYIRATDVAGSFTFITGANNFATQRLNIASNGDLSLYEDTGTTAKFFWNASNESLGLNNINPSATYSVDAAKGIRVSAAAPNFTLQETDAANQSWLMASYGGTFAIRDTTVSGTAYPLQIEAATPSNTLYLDSSGKVGIGTALPTNGKLVIEESGTSVGSTIRLIGTNTSGSASQVSHITSYQPAGGSAEASALDFKVRGTDPYATPSTVMTLLGGGNVGIGTSSPSTLMEIASTSPVLRITNTTDAAWSAGQDIGRLSFYSTDASAVGPHETAFILNESDFGGSQLSGALSFGTAAYNAAATERMRIDSSGNLLVGKAGTSISSTGIEAKADGQLWATRDGNPVLSLNRKTSDGSMAVFYKDGATVGSIGNFGDNLGIESVDVGLLFLSGSNQIVPTGGNFGVSDGTKDLGRSTTRFKDLYLSGGVVFGTTGGSVTSKTLDDYEEGTWTPVYAPTSGSFTTMTMSTPDCTYTKVGRMVTVSGIIRTNDVDVTGASGAVIISGLPFAVASWSAISLGRVQDFGGDMPDSGYGGGSATNINLYYRATSNGATSTLNVTDMQDGTVSSANYIFLEYTYQTT